MVPTAAAAVPQLCTLATPITTPTPADNDAGVVNGGEKKTTIFDMEHVLFTVKGTDILTWHAVAVICFLLSVIIILICRCLCRSKESETPERE
jgi:hypothetical protein